MVSNSQQCRYIHGQRKAETNSLSSLKVASRHFARLCVALKVVADLLAFNDFAHASAFNSRNVNEGVSAAVVRLNEAEALGGIKPFNCASGHDEPFHSNIKPPQRGCATGYDNDCFKGRVRSGRGANRAVTKAQQENIDG
jgi:hypothetical protein